MSKKYLGKAYGARDPAATRKLYDEWSASYDAELDANGYATPGRCADALKAFVADQSQPILDFGCGTGLSGLALTRAGFTCIDGVDLSADMLAQAQAKGIYRSTRQIEAGATPKHIPTDYAAIAAIGVIGVGAAPASTFDLLMNSIAKGRKLVFSLNDHALADKSFEGRLNEWTDCGGARLLFREYGLHLPGIGLKSNVYIIEKN